MQSPIDHTADLNLNPAWRGLAMLDHASRSIGAGGMNEALEAVFAALEQTRDNLPAEDWKDFARYVGQEHDLAGAVRQDPMTHRALAKPRGYAGDAVMMDYLYGVHSAHEAFQGATPLGREIFRRVQGRPAAEAVRFRRQHIAALIDNVAAAVYRPSILAVAAGHLREAELSRAVRAGRLGRFVALDADAASMQEVAAEYAGMGVETMHASVRQILARKLQLGEFDFVYAAGLYDYLAGPTARSLTTRLFEMTKPGGRLLIPNFTPRVRDRAYMEAFMDWRLIYRDESDMGGLMGGIDPPEIASWNVYTDPAGSVVYLSVTKAAFPSAPLHEESD